MSVNKKIIETEAQVSLEDAFNIVTYTGNSSTQSITGVGFKPDLVWIKRRNSAESHALYDSIRGINKQLETNSTAAEATNTAPYEGVNSFDADGFTTGDNGGTNRSPNTYVAWCWRANGGNTSSNTDGSITSTVQANQDAGFSIVSYTGTGSNATVGHGLSSAPEFIIVKNRSDAQLWTTGSSILNNANAYSDLNSGKWYESGTPWNSTQPTSSVFSVGTYNGTNGSGDSMIAYCFHSVDGFSKFGSYTGNGSCDTSNPIQNCGFRPDYVLLKNVTDGGHWGIFDSARGGTGQNNKQLTAESNGAEYTGLSGCDYVKFEDTGFRVTTDNSAYNGSGKTIMYMAYKIAS